MTGDKIECRTPTPGKQSTRIDLWRFQVVRSAILTVVPAAQPGVLFRDLPSLVAAQIASDDLERLGSIGWYTTTVKLELEVRGEIERVPGATPQRLRRCG